MSFHTRWAAPLVLLGLVLWVGHSGTAAGAERRIALVSDPHVSINSTHTAYIRNFERVIDDVNGAKVDAVLLAGDLTQNGDAPSMERFAAMVKRFVAPTRWVAGNHDIGNKPMAGGKGPVSAERIERYEALLGATFYAVDLLPDVRVIGVASSLFTSGLPAEAAQWRSLEEELGKPLPADGKSRRILLTHYPLFVTSPDEADEYFNINTPARRRLVELIKNEGLTTILAGHLHRPNDTTVGQIPVIGAPAVSFGLPRGKQGVGWTMVTIDDAGRVRTDNRYVPDASPATPSTTSATTRPADQSLLVDVTPASDRIHIFYYNWYGAPPLQKEFRHWQQGNHTPPDDIGANFYPKLGPYSSFDPAVLKQHMQWIRQAGAGTLCLTWWGRESYEEKGTQSLLDAAADAGLKVNFHLEPYKDHTPTKLADDVRFILGKYGGHAAFYRAAAHGNKGMFYVFETGRHPSEAWREGLASLRANGAEHVLIIAQTSDLSRVEAGGFDGGYTYDGLAPFKNPAFLAEWKATAETFASAGKLFIPSVGPGYWDDRAVRNRGAVEPDAARTRDDGNATTYDAAWRAAIAARPPFVTVTSFNEWHEGSQIEPAVAKKIDNYEYPAYRLGEDQYLKNTAKWVGEFVRESGGDDQVTREK